MTLGAGGIGAGELDGRVALVTGAAGGIGSAVVAQLLAAGAAVVGEDIDAMSAPHGSEGRFIAVQGDSAETATAQQAVKAAVNTFGRLDILVNLAGRFFGKRVVDTTNEEWDALMVTNVRSVFVHCREAIPALLESGSGSIVTGGSTGGLLSIPAGGGLYGVTKAAITQITRQLAGEYAAAGLRANVIAPGVVDTTFVSRTQSVQPTPEEYEARQKFLGALHPMGRMASPEEVAELIVFLASPRASFITGVVVPIDGGLMAV
jgi:NAD(P)-dependent dehydrogenase (short-subunit alcohol dehydrogenase family)